MKQRLGATARGLAVAALSGLLAAGGCISQRANENDTMARGTAIQTSSATIDQSRALDRVRGLSSNVTPRTRYLGPADPAIGGNAVSGTTTLVAPVGQFVAAPDVATNVTPPVSGTAFIGSAGGAAVPAGDAGTNLTGTAIIPGSADSLRPNVVGGMAPGPGGIADSGAAITANTTSAPVAITGTAGALASASATGTAAAPGVAGTVTAPGIAGPISNQTLTASAPAGVVGTDLTTTGTGRTMVNDAGVAGTVTAPGVAGPVSNRTFTGTAPLGVADGGQVIVVPRATSGTTITSNANTTVRSGSTTRVRIRPNATTQSNLTVGGSTTRTGGRVLIGAAPISATRTLSGRVVVTNQTTNQR